MNTFGSNKLKNNKIKKGILYIYIFIEREREMVYNYACKLFVHMYADELNMRKLKYINLYLYLLLHIIIF